MIKNPTDKVPETIRQIRYASMTLLGFIALLLAFIITGLVVIIVAYKPPLWMVIGVVFVFVFCFCYVLIKTINNAIKNPQPFIFNQNAFITVLREKLQDSDSPDSYFSDELDTEKVKSPQMQLPHKIKE